MNNNEINKFNFTYVIKELWTRVRVASRDCIQAQLHASWHQRTSWVGGCVSPRASNYTELLQHDSLRSLRHCMSSYQFSRLLTACKSLINSPRDAAWLHVVGQGDIITPDVKLPLAQPQDPTEHVASVNAYPHVHIEARCFTDEPGTDKLCVRYTTPTPQIQTRFEPRPFVITEGVVNSSYPSPLILQTAMVCTACADDKK
jgi:hypothetical protein